MAEEIVPPQIVGIKLQPLTHSEESTVSGLENQVITFYGHKGNENRAFKTLAGEGSPTLTGGWVKIAKVQRFQRVSVTVPEGYDPLVLTIPLLFDNTVKYASGIQTKVDVEAAIQSLEWMAGRPAHPNYELTGEPPYVEVFSANPRGEQTNLIPLPFQTVPGVSQQWYVSQITFDTNALRNQKGDRVRQSATVELTEIILSPTALRKAREIREQSKNRFQTFKTTSQINTVRRVAAFVDEPAAWKAILEANPKLGTNADKKLDPGTKVKIPLTIFVQVPR